MIDYRFNGRLTYIPGGALSVNMSAWPAAGGNWWEPTTGSFTCVAAYQAKGAADLASSYVNLANPGTYNLIVGTAPTFDSSTGWTFNGSTQWMRIDLIIPVTYTVIYRFVSGTQAAGYHQPFGSYASASQQYIISPYHNSAVKVYAVGSNTVTRGTTPASGVIGFSGWQPYLDGTADGAALSSGGTNVRDAYIGAVNSGFAANFWAGSLQAVAIYSTTLDATQMAEITTNMQAL